MDFTDCSIKDLKRMRDKYKERLTNMKYELYAARLSNNKSRYVARSDKDGVVITRCMTPKKHVVFTKEEKLRQAKFLKAVCGIESLNINVKPVRPNYGDTDLFVFKCKIKFNKLVCEIEYESNVSPIDIIPSKEEEVISKINMKIVTPNLQSKLQKGIDFIQQSTPPLCLGSAILFFKTLHDLMEMRTKVVKKLHEFKKNIMIGISKNSDQHSIIFKSSFDDKEFLHVKWNFKFEERTALVRDFLTAKIVRAGIINQFYNVTKKIYKCILKTIFR